MTTPAIDAPRRLDFWSVQVSPSPGDDLYTAPELAARRLVGFLGSFEGGARVRTSRVVGVRERVVVTSSGSSYVLGRIDPAYREYLAEHHPGWDWRDPL